MPEEERNYVSFEQVDNGHVDWRAKGAVTGVKDQGNCGSCWTFAATGVIEGAHYIKNGILNNFSQQQLLDCDKRSIGCGGGSPANAYTYW